MAKQITIVQLQHWLRELVKYPAFISELSDYELQVLRGHLDREKTNEFKALNDLYLANPKMKSGDIISNSLEELKKAEKIILKEWPLRESRMERTHKEAAKAFAKASSPAGVTAHNAFDKIFDESIKNKTPAIKPINGAHKEMLRAHHNYSFNNWLQENRELIYGDADQYLKVCTLANFKEYLTEVYVLEQANKESKDVVHEYQHTSDKGSLTFFQKLAKQIGLKLNPVHDFEKLKYHRYELFENKDKKLLIHQNDANGLPTTSEDIELCELVWLTNETSVIEQWLSDTYPNGDKKGAAHAKDIAGKVNIMKYQKHVQQRIKQIEDNSSTKDKKVELDVEGDLALKVEDELILRNQQGDEADKIILEGSPVLKVSGELVLDDNKEDHVEGVPELTSMDQQKFSGERFEGERKLTLTEKLDKYKNWLWLLFAIIGIAIALTKLSA